LAENGHCLSEFEAGWKEYGHAEAVLSWLLSWQAAQRLRCGYILTSMEISDPQRSSLSSNIKVSVFPLTMAQKVIEAPQSFPSIDNHTRYTVSSSRLQQIAHHNTTIMGSTYTSRKNSKLFSPIRLGEMNLGHRVIMSAMTRLRCPGSVPKPIVTEYYTQRASRGGLLVTEGMHPSFMVSPPKQNRLFREGIPLYNR